MGVVLYLFICEFGFVMRVFLGGQVLWWKMWTFIQVSFCFLRVEGVIINMICLFCKKNWVASHLSGIFWVDVYGREYVTR